MNQQDWTQSLATQTRPHVILCGEAVHREAVVGQVLDELSIHLEIYQEASKLPTFVSFSDKINEGKPVTFEEITVDDIGVRSALYLFDPDQIGREATSSSLDLVKKKAKGQGVEVYPDLLLAGTDISANEGPGISPGGVPRLLPSAINAALSKVEQPEPFPGGEDTAIIILDTAPDGFIPSDDPALQDDAHQWTHQSQLVDGAADFTRFMLHDPNVRETFREMIDKRVLPIGLTKKMQVDRHKAVQHHGLMVASLCRDQAPADTQLILLRVQDINGIGTIHVVCSALYYALELRRQGLLPPRLIFNLSLGLPTSGGNGVDSHCLLEAITDVLREDEDAANQDKNYITFVVCAAGNANPLALDDGRPDPEEPAAFYSIEQQLQETSGNMPSGSLATSMEVELKYLGIDPVVFRRRLLCVGASDRADGTDKLAVDYAPFSKKADLVAPGMGMILRTADEQGNSTFTLWSGSSFAVPQVSALVARLLVANADPDHVHSILKDTGHTGSGDSTCQIDPDAALADLDKDKAHTDVGPQPSHTDQHGTSNKPRGMNQNGAGQQSYLSDSRTHR